MILATLNLSSGEWAVTEEDESSSVAVGFTSNTMPVAFDNLSFGWSLAVNGSETDSKKYPEIGAVYVSTDQKYLSSDTITIGPDDECFLTVWAENAGERSETAHEWVVPRPESPFPSWIWDAERKMWEAPVPRPEDEIPYIWDEESGSWVEYVPGA